MPLGGVAKIVENNAGLNPGNTPRRIDFQDLVHVLRKIQDHSDVAALAGERGTAAAAQNGSAKFTRQRNCGDDIIYVAWEDNTDRDLAIVGTVGGVQSAAAGIEADFTAKVAAQSGFER
jgi:hypothetical protein